MNTHPEHDARPIDYDGLTYVTTPTQSLLCPVCKNVLNAPLQTSCAHKHSMCTRCLTRALEDKLECPVDRTPMPDGLEECSRSPRLIYDIIDELEVLCPNAGCNESFPRGLLPWHVKCECSFELLMCSAEHCSERVLRKDVKEGQCEHRLVLCDHCGTEVMAKNIIGHLEECSELSHQCSYCHIEFSAEDMRNHVCHLEPIACEASAIGCTTISTREEIVRHSQNCPLKMLMPWCESQKLEVTKLKLENQVLRHSIASIDETRNTEPTIEVSSQYERDRDYLFSSLESLSTTTENLSSALAALDTKQGHMAMSESIRNKEETAMIRGGLQALRMQWHHFLQNTRNPIFHSAPPPQTPQLNGESGPSRSTTAGRTGNDGSRVKL